MAAVASGGLAGWAERSALGPSAAWPPEGRYQDGFGSCFTGGSRPRTGRTR